MIRKVLGLLLGGGLLFIGYKTLPKDSPADYPLSGGTGGLPLRITVNPQPLSEEIPHTRFTPPNFLQFLSSNTIMKPTKKPANAVYDHLFIKYGGLYGINAKVLKSIAIQESSLNPSARAITSSAYGLMQMTKAAASDISEDWNRQNDPETSIRSGAKYLRLQMDSHSFTLEKAIQAYYAGAGTIITGDSGDTFNKPWQAGAYLFAKNVYQPKILKRANTLTV